MARVKLDAMLRVRRREPSQWPAYRVALRPTPEEGARLHVQQPPKKRNAAIRLHLWTGYQGPTRPSPRLRRRVISYR